MHINISAYMCEYLNTCVNVYNNSCIYVCIFDVYALCRPLAPQAPDTGKTMRKLRGSEAAKLTVSGMVLAKATGLAIMLRGGEGAHYSVPSSHETANDTIGFCRGFGMLASPQLFRIGLLQKPLEKPMRKRFVCAGWAPGGGSVGDLTARADSFKLGGPPGGPAATQRKRRSPFP